MAALEPGDGRGRESREAGCSFVGHDIPFRVRQVERLVDALADCDVEELQPTADEPLHAAAVEPREARELLVVCEVELCDDERQHLRVLGANAVIRGRGQPELATQPPEESGRAPKAGRKLLVGLEPGEGLGHEHAYRKRELACGDALRHRLERDPGLLERSHQPDDVDVGRREEAVLVRGEQPERL